LIDVRKKSRNFRLRPDPTLPPPPPPTLRPSPRSAERESRGGGGREGGKGRAASERREANSPGGESDRYARIYDFTARREHFSTSARKREARNKRRFLLRISICPSNSFPRPAVPLEESQSRDRFYRSRCRILRRFATSDGSLPLPPPPVFSIILHLSRGNFAYIDAQTRGIPSNVRGIPL